MRFAIPSWLRSVRDVLGNRSKRRKKPTKLPAQRRGLRLQVEALEDRLVPSTVYFNDFESTVGSEWSNTTTSATPVGSRGFLGEFSNETASLSLTGLGQHNSITVSFDLYVISSWDGNSTLETTEYGILGPDVWDLSVGDQSLIHTTFSNHFNDSISSTSTRQAFRDAFGDGDYAAGTGAAETNTLGYMHPVQTSTPMDSVYHLTVTFDHLDSNLQIDFSALGLQGITDESWGLDNVTVEACYLPKEYVVHHDNSKVEQAAGLCPCDTCPTPVRTADGTVAVTNGSFSSGGFGTGWGESVTWSNNSAYSQGGANGNGNFSTTMPYLLEGCEPDSLVAVIGGTDAIYFDLDGSTYIPRFFGQETLTYDSMAGLYTLTDTAGNRLVFHDFDAGLPQGQRGQLESFTDPAGNVTEVISRNSAGRPTEVQRSATVDGQTTTESYLYAYVGSGANAGLMESATLRRKVDSGSWDVVRKTEYSYYENSDSFGGDGDLKLSVIKDGSGNILDRSAYRYYDGESGGFVHGLKYVFDAPSYARLIAAGFDPFTSTDAQVAPFASMAFQYDALQRVTQMVAQGEGCSSCSAGQGTYTYAYFTSAHPQGFNSWHTRTVETLPDGSTSTTYANAFGQEMLRVFTDVTTDLEYLTYTRYDEQGRTILTANPSAVSGFDEAKADLLDLEDGNYQYLRDDAGLVTTFTYYATTTAGETTAGGAAGYLQSTAIQQGELGTRVLQSSMEYFVHSGGGATVVPVASTTVYRSQANGSDAGFETPHVGTGTNGAFDYDPAGSAWDFDSSSGVAGNGSGFTSGNPNAPQGTQVAFLQNAGALSQSYYFDAGTYTLSFLAAQRQNHQPGGAQTIEVFLDSTSLGTFTPGSTSYTLQMTASFTVTAGNHTLEFVGLGSGDSTAFIDAVSVQAVSGAQTTSYAYTFFTDSTRIASIATSLPVVSAAQNGPGTADVSDVVFDENGRPTWTRDAEGYINHFAYDVGTGALLEMIVDVDTALTTDEPAGWTTPANGGLHLVTTMEVDNLGRETKRVSPNGNITYAVYNDPDHEMRVYRGWNQTTDRPTGPTEVHREDRPGSYVETLTMAATPAVDVNGRPTGAEAISDIQTLSRSYISAGGQVTHVDNYFFLGTEVDDAGFETPDVGTGSSAYVGHPTGSAWTFSGALTDAYGTASDPDTNKSGVAGNNSGFTSGNPNAPQGTQVAFLQGASTISQALSFAAGTYTLSFQAAQRQNHQPAGNQTIQVLVDGAVVATITPSGTSYATYTTASFTLTAGVHTLAFVGQNTTGDSTAFIDQVSVSPTNTFTYSTAPNLGTDDVHFYRTHFDYDKRGRQHRTERPTGTIYRTEYDGLGRVVSRWVGTDDVPTTGFWSVTNTAGTDMVQTVGYGYDNGGVGDSNLTQMTAIPGGSAANRVSEYAFDWRNRRVAGKSGVEGTESTSLNRPIFYTEYDNLGQVIASEQYDGDGLSITADADSDGVPDRPSAGLLRARQTFDYDDQGRAFRSHVFLVDQTTGAISSGSLTSESFFDQRGTLIKSLTPGGLVSKVQIDGAGRVIKSFTTDGGGDSGWADADDVAGDVVLEQSETEYDANGNAILNTFKRRFHDETGTGELGDASNGVRARVAYMAAYFDLADRMTDSVNVGTNGGSAYTRPGTVPARSDTVLVSSTTYNSAGWVENTTDPRGIVSRTDYDALGRTVRTVQAFVDGTPSAADDRTTAYSYDGSNNTLTVTAVLPDGAVQTTQYLYGVTTGSGSGINSNDIRSAIRYPDPTTGLPSSSEQETYTVNALAQTLTATDRNGTTHSYTYDVLGRLTSDTATTLGSGVDGAVRRIDTAYDTAGRAFLFTSYADTAGTAIANQVQRAYNGLGQLIAEYQAHSGAVNTSTTPKVQYAYSEMAGGANHSRLVSMTYPNGRVITYDYGTVVGLDDRISRLNAIKDGSTTLEGYSYLGLGTVVERLHPESGVDLSYVKLGSESVGDAGDPYTGLDRFDRVVDQRWRDGATDLDRFFYGYDRDSNRTSKENALNSDLDEFYSYDLLNQLTGFTRADGHDQSWDIDAEGNFNTVNTDGVDEDRTHNAQNELTGVGAAALTYDANGSLTTDETGRKLVYDAWNRLVEVQDASNATLVLYSYDAHGWRITEDKGTVRDFFYSTAWQVLEERTGGVADVQYVWSPVYIDAMILRDRDTNNDGSLDERLYVSQDANFNVTALVETAGAVVERYEYDPYGVQTTFDLNWGDIATSTVGFVHGHQGLRAEIISGLHWNRNRDYSATLMRFVQNDPAGMINGTNLYLSNLDNPFAFTDPYGLDVYYMVAPNAACCLGHAAVIVGPIDGTPGKDRYVFMSFSAGAIPSVHAWLTRYDNIDMTFYDSIDAARADPKLARYEWVLGFPTNRQKSQAAVYQALNWYGRRYGLVLSNCGDLAGDVVLAAGIPFEIRKTPRGTIEANYNLTRVHALVPISEEVIPVLPKLRIP